MNIDLQAKRAAFRALHEQGCFVIPNPWDIGSVRRLEKLGFQAHATTSAGYAWSRGREDGQLTRDEVLGHLRELCAATDVLNVEKLEREGSPSTSLSVPFSVRVFR
jgi:2-methylisocitrate lyase-like PEP mutase family enzyme